MASTTKKEDLTALQSALDSKDLAILQLKAQSRRHQPC